MNKKLLILTLISGFIVLITCKELEKEMLVSTGEVDNSSITANSANVDGMVVDLGGGAIEHGHCYGTTPNLTISGTKTSLGTPRSGGFTSTINNLDAGTKYYVKAYISDGSQAVYGKEIYFSTLAASLPEIITTAISSITRTTAASGGNITSDGGAPVTARGVCWNTDAAPTIENSKTTDETGTGIFTSDLSNLIPGTVYYVRAYATNSAGTSYGEQLQFSTVSISLPTLTTAAVRNITETSATGEGNITDNGGSAVTASGVCWNTTNNPDITGSHTTDGNPLGTFTSSISGLTAGTTYYVRAYATNDAGTAYGNEVSFTTNSPAVLIPTLSTTAITGITSTTATGGGNITNDGGGAITASGVCWSTTKDPDVSDSHTTDGSTSGTFTSSISGLTANTLYYVRAYATNSAGTAYGNEVSFTTSAAALLPTVFTTNVTEITTTTATGGGTITSDGGATVTASGVCWSTTTNPAVTGSHTTDGSISGTYTSSITGLSANTKYYVRAYATNSVGTAYGDEKSFITSAGVTAPTAPIIGVATAGNQEATVTFTPPASDGGSAIVAYTVTSSPGSFFSTGSASPITVGGLTNGTAYTFTVTATNAIGTSPASDASNSVTPSTIPYAPIIGTATAGDAEASVTFTPPSFDGGSAITGYTVTSSPGGFIGTGSASPITVTGLLNGISYTFTVTATNNNGTSTASASSNSVVPSTVPDTPTIGTATAGNAQASVTFTAPTNDGGSAITGYTVTSSPDNKVGIGTASPIIVNGLINGTTYTFTVTAKNAIGTSVASAASNSVTPSTVPDAPIIGAATAGNQEATVTFTAPGSDGGSAITGYTVTSSPGGFTGTGTVSPITVTGLANGTAYTFTVTATNINGTSVASATSNSTTPSTIPGVPTGVSATAGNAQATVTFTPPVNNGGSTITGYTVTSSPGGFTGTGPTSPVTVIGLTNGTAYTFTVTATNASGTSATSSASNSVTPSTVPGQPTGISATAGNAQATITFTAPNDDGGSTVTGYTVTSNPGGLTNTGSASPISVTGLINGTSYTFTVVATNINGNSVSSTPSNSVIPSTVPGAPTGVSATAGNSNATVTFTAPVNDGGSAIIGYTVTSSPDGKTSTGSASPITVSGLSNTAYTFTVTATNANGTGAASTPSNSVTVTTVPDAPVIGTAAAGNALATVTFWPSNDGGSSIIGFTVTSSPGGITVFGSASPIKVTGLNNGTNYTFTVTATNTNGTSTASSPTNSVTPSTTIGIGSSYQGGVVAYIFQSGEPGYVSGQTHGLIAAQQDISYWGVEWWNGSNITTGATGSALGTGTSNTISIVSAQGNTGSYAAKNCYDLVIDGYGDFYLPSKDELNKLYINHTSIGGFKTSSAYWSSTESSSTGAWVQGMGNGSQSPTLKQYGYLVRAIRTF